MAKLSTATRKKEPSTDFGLPKEREYSMPDAAHAKNARARASQMAKKGKLSAADKKKIDAKADRKLGNRSARTALPLATELLSTKCAI